MSEWISVKDRLPKELREVMFYDGEEMWIGYRLGGLWCEDYFTFKESKITHWMPLPEPPKEEES